MERMRVELVLLTEQFGGIVAKVAKTMYAGEKTLRQMSDETKLALDLTRDCLCALLQHDLVTEILSPVSGDPKAPKKVHRKAYAINHQKILLRTYIPRVLTFVGTNHGEDAEMLVQQMLLHGRVRLPMLVKYMQGIRASVTEASVNGIFEDLLADHLVTLRMSPSSGVVQDSLSTAGEDGMLDPFAIPIPQPGKRKAEGESDIPDRAGGGKRQKLNSGDAVDSGYSSEVTHYWVVNYRQFMRHFRNDWIVEHITQKIDRTAGDITKALLAKDLLNPASETGSSMPLTPRDIRQELTGAGFGLDGETLNEYLRVLVADSDGLVINQSPYYQVDLAAAIRLVKLTYIRKVILFQFGEQSYRLFQLVLQNSHLEQKQLKDMALVGSFKETKQLLNYMLRGQFLALREVPKQGNREPSNCLYLWTCNLPAICTMMQQRCFKTKANLSVRWNGVHQKYLETKRKVDQIPADLDEDPEAEEADLKRAKEHRDEMVALQRTLDRLEHAKLEIDTQSLIFRDFEASSM